MKIFQVVSLEAVSVLMADAQSGFLCGKDLLAVGWKLVCRQPCASWQFLEAAPGLHLCKELLSSDPPFLGHLPLVPSDHMESGGSPDNHPHLGPGSAWHSIFSSIQSASNSLYEGPFLINILTAHSISVLLLRTQPATGRFVLA